MREVSDEVHINWLRRARSFREADRFSASDEMPRLLRNAKVHQSLHTMPQLNRILSIMNLFYILIPFSCGMALRFYD
jgi:hypothetical protein